MEKIGSVDVAAHGVPCRFLRTLWGSRDIPYTDTAASVVISCLKSPTVLESSATGTLAAPSVTLSRSIRSSLAGTLHALHGCLNRSNRLRKFGSEREKKIFECGFLQNYKDRNAGTELMIWRPALGSKRWSKVCPRKPWPLRPRGRAARLAGALLLLFNLVAQSSTHCPRLYA